MQAIRKITAELKTYLKGNYLMMEFKKNVFLSMFKSLSFAFMLTSVLIVNCCAQTANFTNIKETAIKDAKSFKLDPESLKKFKATRSNSTSDFFKPTTLSTTNAGMLNDSVYVKSFREAAYKNTKKLNVAGHHKRIGILGYAAAIVFVGLVFLGLNQL